MIPQKKKDTDYNNRCPVITIFVSDSNLIETFSTLFLLALM